MAFKKETEWVTETTIFLRNLRETTLSSARNERRGRRVRRSLSRLVEAETGRFLKGLSRKPKSEHKEKAA